jgi:2-polyprenyl-6-methoxyphenol hydroxylase-like FAD-dependent oxidoreductase
MTPIDVSVSGSGPVGAAGALALAGMGLRVALPAPPPADGRTDIRAYALNAPSRSLLQHLKVWSALPPDAVTPVYDMFVRGDAAGSALDFSAWTQKVEALAWIVDAAELDRALQAALQFAPRVQRMPAGAVLPPAALRVIAEGKAFTGSAQGLGVDVHRHRYGQTAIGARLVADRPHRNEARQWFGSPDVLGLLPISRPEVGHSWSLVWSLPDARARELLDAPPAAFEAALMDASGGEIGALSLHGERAAWPLTLARADRTTGPGWVLVGDAAHVVHPLAGQGLNLGLADVAALERVLAGREPWRTIGDEALLRRYARQRSVPTLAMGAMTDSLLQLFAHEAPLVRKLRNQGLALVNHLAPLKRALAAQAIGAADWKSR